MSEYLFHGYVEDCPPAQALPHEQRHALTPDAVMRTPAEVVEWLEWLLASMYGTDSADDAGDTGYWRQEWLRQAESGGRDIVLNLDDLRTVTVAPVVHPAQDVHWHVHHEEVHASRVWTEQQRRAQVPALAFPNPADAAGYLGEVAALFLGVDRDEYSEANGEEIGFWENQLVTMRRVFTFSQGPDLHVTIDTVDGPECHLCHQPVG